MSAIRLELVEEIFHSARVLHSPERETYLESSCAGDAELRAEVEALLQSHAKLDDFIQESPSSLAAELLADEAGASPIGRTIGHYEVLERIGSGGMGDVYLARDLRSGRKAALKLLPLHFAGDAERFRRFQQEARAVVALNHPHILTTYEIGEENGTHYIIGELIEGKTLREHLRSGSIGRERALEIGIQVASALVAAHKAGIVHRDIKPENIMLREDGYVKVLDFGIAKLAEEVTTSIRKADAARFEQTTFGATVGTLHYMSPEQARGDHIDHRTDLWSLGVVLYEMLSGTLPFTGSSPDEIVASIRDLQPAPLRDQPGRVQRIISRTLAKDRAQRFATAGELLEALKQCHREIEAGSPSWPQRRVLIPAALLLLSGVLAAGLWSARVRRAPQSEVPEKSIAVLPFQNLSEEPENAVFADGVQEEILTNLTKVADLKVISRTSVMQFREPAKRKLSEIAQALKVAHVLEGSVQRSSNRVRVTAQLIDARTDTHLWAERYDRELADVFGIQSEIAQEIVARLDAMLTPKERAVLQSRPTQDTAAYDLYLRAKNIDRSSRTHLREGIEERVALLDQAVARDPGFVPALCMLAEAHLLAYFYRWDQTPGRLELARKPLEAAALLQPDAAEVHRARATFHYRGKRDYARALEELALARRSAPNDADILYLIGAVEFRQGRWEECLRTMQQAVVLDPRNVRLAMVLAEYYRALARYGEARRILDELVSWKPEEIVIQTQRAWLDFHERADLTAIRNVLLHAPAADPHLAHDRVHLAFLERDYRAAEQALLQQRETSPYAEGIIARGLGDAPRAQAAFVRSRERAAAQLVDAPDDPHVVMRIASAEAQLGRKEEARRAGERALELLPLARYPNEHMSLLCYMAEVYAQIGDTDRALDLIQRSRALGMGPSYGELRLMEEWDALRNDPRFEKLVASFAPKSSPP